MSDAAQPSPEYVARAVREWTWSGVSRVEPIEGLDPGIAPWVELLRAWRIETFESCQGGPDPERPERGHAYPEPTIAFAGGPEAGFRAYAIAVTHGLPIYGIRRVWKHTDHELNGPCWEIVFTRQATPEEAAEIAHTLAFERGDEMSQQTDREKVVVSFTLPSNGERWNWPIEGADGIDAFVEILDRANIPYKVRHG